MSLKKTLLAAGLLAVVPLLAIAQTTQSDSVGHAWAGHSGGHGAALGFLRGVTLTDAQRTQMHTLLHTERTNTSALRQQERALRKDIADRLASTEAVTEAQMNALQQKADTIRQQLESQRLATALKVRALLTPDQLAQSAQVHQQLAALRAQTRSVLGHSDAAAP